jgi:hypothetical protein
VFAGELAQGLSVVQTKGIGKSAANVAPGLGEARIMVIIAERKYNRNLWTAERYSASAADSPFGELCRALKAAQRCAISIFVSLSKLPFVEQ